MMILNIAKPLAVVFAMIFSPGSELAGRDAVVRDPDRGPGVFGTGLGSRGAGDQDFGKRNPDWNPGVPAVVETAAGSRGAGDQDRDGRESEGPHHANRILEHYLLEAAENNPELRARFYEYQAALERVPQAGALPDPQLSLGYFIRPMQFPMGDQRADLSLMQMFPWFGTLSAREDEASRMSWARYESFRDVKNRTFYEVKSAWYELYELEREVEIMESNLDLLRELEELALMRFQSTEPGRGGGMADVLRVRMEINEMENRIALLADSRVPVTARFNKLLNRQAHVAVALPDTLDTRALTAPRKALLDDMIRDNPMIRMLDEEADAYGVRERIARMEGRPSFGAGLNYMIFSAPSHGEALSMDGRNMIMPMITMTIPIYRGKYRAMERQARLERQAIVSSREDLENELSVQLTDVMRDLADAERRLDLYARQADLADKSMEILITDYAGGLVRFEEVLRLQEQLLGYRLLLLRAVADHNRTAARLDMLTSTELSESRE
jgi:outer membrane protein TolC